MHDQWTLQATVESSKNILTGSQMTVHVCLSWKRHACCSERGRAVQVASHSGKALDILHAPNAGAATTSCDYPCCAGLSPQSAEFLVHIAAI